MNKKSLLIVLAATVAVFVVGTGCSNAAAEGANNTPSTSNPTASTTPKLTLAEPAEPKDAIPSAPAKKAYVIGVSLLKQDDDFYKALKQGLIDQGTKQKVTMDIE